MYYQFLIEDQSGATLIRIIMEKVKKRDPDITYDIKAFKGIGGFTKKNTVRETKTGKLLNDLATFLKGFNKSLQTFEAVVFIVLDNDNNDPVQFKSRLEEVAAQNMITIDYVFCLAIEEMEAWLLGDEAAVISAYPHARISELRKYEQDSICGTWEKLADVIYKGGQQAMKKQLYSEQGRIKSEWALKIGPLMDISQNKSPSFNYFIGEVLKRTAVA